MPCCHQLGHGADGFLDRDVGIDAVLVIQVDDVDAEALQAGLAGFDDILGAAVDAVGLAGALGLAELRRHHHAVAAAFQGATEHLLVMAPAVHVGGVEMVHAGVDGVADQVFRHRVVGGAVDAGQRHAAQADGRDGQAALAEGAMFQFWLRRHEGASGDGFSGRLCGGGAADARGGR